MKPTKPKLSKAAVKPKAKAPAKPKGPRIQDTRELRTLRTPWGLGEWLGRTAAQAKTSRTAIIIEGLTLYLDKTRLKPKPISEERAALMRKVANLARRKTFPGVSLISDPEPLKPAEVKALLSDPAGRELHELACEEMSRPNAADLAGA